MKIKQTRQVRLDELLKYVWNNGVNDIEFHSDNDSWVRIDDYGDLTKVYEVESTDLFTITEEVEITEDIALDEMVIVQTKYFDGHKTKYVTRVVNRSIKECKRTKDTTLHEAWTINGNGIGELIWSKERGLVD